VNNVLYVQPWSAVQCLDGSKVSDGEQHPRDHLLLLSSSLPFSISAHSPTIVTFSYSSSISYPNLPSTSSSLLRLSRLLPPSSFLLQLHHFPSHTPLSPSSNHSLQGKFLPHLTHHLLIIVFSSQSPHPLFTFLFSDRWNRFYLHSK
jgi:hypothetical protein